MTSALRSYIAAFIGLGVLAGIGAWLGVRFVQSNSGSRDDSAQSASGQEDPADSLVGREARADSAPAPAVSPVAPDPAARRDEQRWAEMREAMVEFQIRQRGVRDERVLAAMNKVPRHRFVPSSIVELAYDDCPQGIGQGQTISQPYIVALMTELARPTADSIALDVGTGSGYQAAILAEVCREVYGIEIIESLAEQARKRLADLGYDNVAVRSGDGYRGWPEKAPFDLIIVAAAPDHIPQPLVDQLREGGRLVIPVGNFFQSLKVVEKGPGDTSREWTVTGVQFVPMTGEAQKRPKGRQ
jgi:protein-L-isoaspartate(D-aspartate) O-methyltransferase